MFTFLADVEDNLPSEPRSLGLLCFLLRVHKLLACATA